MESLLNDCRAGGFVQVQLWEIAAGIGSGDVPKIVILGGTYCQTSVPIEF
jgi:hypothetical protein